MKIVLPRRALFAEPTSLSRLKFSTGLRQLPGKLMQYVIAYRQAKAAEEMHMVLSRMSDADLARHGIDRRDIMRRVREQLDQPKK